MFSFIGDEVSLPGETSVTNASKETASEEVVVAGLSEIEVLNGDQRETGSQEDFKGRSALPRQMMFV